MVAVKAQWLANERSWDPAMRPASWLQFSTVVSALTFFSLWGFGRV
jgi:hypothetical protein